MKCILVMYIIDCIPDAIGEWDEQPASMCVHCHPQCSRPCPEGALVIEAVPAGYITLCFSYLCRNSIKVAKINACVIVGRCELYHANPNDSRCACLSLSYFYQTILTMIKV